MDDSRPPLPLLTLSLAVEGPALIGASLSTLTTVRGGLALAGLGFTVLAATLVGSGLWTALMSRHPASTVAPFSMLVPVVGIAASAVLLLHESTPAVELVAGAVVVTGVLVSARPQRGARTAVAGGGEPATAMVATGTNHRAALWRPRGSAVRLEGRPR